MTTLLSRMTAVAEDLRVAFTEGSTKDCDVAGGVRREIYRPYEIVLTREFGDFATAKAAAEAAGFTATSEDPDATDDYHWRLRYELRTNEARVRVLVVCALDQEYGSYLWYYTGGVGEQVKVNQEAVANGYRGCDEHGLEDASRSETDEATIYTDLYGVYVEPVERLQ